MACIGVQEGPEHMVQFGESDYIAKQIKLSVKLAEYRD